MWCKYFLLVFYLLLTLFCLLVYGTFKLLMSSSASISSHIWFWNFKFHLKSSLLSQSCKHGIICLLLSPNLHSMFHEGRGSESCSSLGLQPKHEEVGIQECLNARAQADRLCKPAFLALSKFSLMSNLHSWDAVCAYLLLLFAETENRYPVGPFWLFFSPSPHQGH